MCSIGSFSAWIRPGHARLPVRLQEFASGAVEQGEPDRNC